MRSCTSVLAFAAGLLIATGAAAAAPEQEVAGPPKPGYLGGFVGGMAGAGAAAAAATGGAVVILGAACVLTSDCSGDDCVPTEERDSCKAMAYVATGGAVVGATVGSVFGVQLAMRSSDPMYRGNPMVMGLLAGAASSAVLGVAASLDDELFEPNGSQVRRLAIPALLVGSAAGALIGYRATRERVVPEGTVLRTVPVAAVTPGGEGGVDITLGLSGTF